LQRAAREGAMAESEVARVRRRKCGRPSASQLAIFALALVLAACATPRETFDLSAAQSGRPRGGGAIVVIDEPLSSAMIDTNRFIIRGPGGDLAYLAEAQWADRTPRLAQLRLIDRLQSRGVDAQRPGAFGAYRLATELRRFEIDEGRQVAIVEIQARLLNDKSSARVAEVTVVGEAPAPTTLGAEAAHAYEAALNAAAERLAAWLRARI
jgi:cholesterol transport system auxiliary component